MRKTNTALILALVVASLGYASASEIYKWTDADGNVQYGDRPVDGATLVTNVQSRPTDNNRLVLAAQSRREQTAAAADAASSNDQGPSDEELRAEAAERAKKCTTFQGRLEKFSVSRRLYREDDNGERVYLDETEMQAARDKVQKQVKDYCSR